MTASAPAATELRASPLKAGALFLLDLVVPAAFEAVDWFRWHRYEAMELGAIVFGLAFAAYFILFAMALLFRLAPVFTAGPDGLGMPMGSSMLVEIPWEEIESYGIVTRKLRLLPLFESRAFGVRLTDAARASDRFPQAYQREFALNRRAMDVDVVLTHWYAPRGLDEALDAARAHRPEREHPEMGKE